MHTRRGRRSRAVVAALHLATRLES
jgi:hypothetical protein